MTKVKKNLISFVERNNKRFLIKLWKEARQETFLSGMPFGRAYIDGRIRGDVKDNFFQMLDEALGEKYPDLACKRGREIT